LFVVCCLLFVVFIVIRLVCLFVCCCVGGCGGDDCGDDGCSDEADDGCGCGCGASGVAMILYRRGHPASKLGCLMAVKARKITENDAILKTYESKAPIHYQPIAGPHIAHAISPKPTYKEHDKYQHLVTNSHDTLKTRTLPWMMRRWPSTSNFTKCNVAAYNIL